MYLKRLEVLGFKSFAEKTELEFGPGITVVVGPNGSGKSNVADAVRWVLGEQSARALRGGNMADVVFAGSDGKRPMGFAQVSIVLDNSDGKMGVGFNEVMVTRRVDRSGEGEYFLNQVPCRLKDVQDLFLDTGVGKESYSIIGQGKIDEILSNKPEERRVIFEEAAGISRYKLRKREAQRRLDETEQNLLRISDVIGELSTQMESLAEQARRAELYHAMHADMTELDIGLMSYHIEQVSERLARQSAENRLLVERLHECEGKLQTGEQAAEVARNLAGSLDQELSVSSMQVAEATGRLERADGRLALARQEQKNAETEQQRLTDEMATLEAKIDLVTHEIASLVEQRSQLHDEIATAAADLTERERTFAAAQTEAAQANRMVEERKNRIVAILQMEAEKRNAAAGADKASEEAARRMARLRGEQTEAQAAIESAGRAADDVAKRRQALSDEKERLLALLASLREKRHATEQLLQRLQQKAATLREQVQGDSSRLGAIEEMINAFEGYQKGARTVLQGREQGRPWAAEVLGAVAELIQTEPRYEKAIEIALGGNIQNLITQTDQGAKQAIEHLKRTNGGRATFLPLNVIRANSYRADEEREFRGVPGVIGVAVELVRFAEQFRPAISSLLGRTLIAEDLDAALAFNRKTGARYRVVTLDGELLAPGGALTGGSVGGHGSGLLSREREREELSARIQRARTELAAIRQQIEEAQRAQASLTEEVQPIEQQLRAVETRATQAESERERLIGEAQRWAAVLETFAVEEAEIQTSAREEGASGEMLRAELARLAEERTSLEEEVEALNVRGRAQVLALDEQGRELTSARVGLAKRNEQVRSLDTQSSRIGAERTALEAERTTRAERRFKVLHRLQEIAEETKAAEEEVSEAAMARQRCDQERARMQARKLEALEQANSREREIRSLRRSQSELQSRLQQGEVEHARLRMEQESIVTRLYEQYHLAPADITGKALPTHQLAAARERIELLREQIRELGLVNPAAIEEYRNAQERFGFLSNQRADLEEAKSALYRAIEELDKRMKSHFLSSFQVIRQEFQQVYTELFEGGKADLVLVDESDLLETGVDIIAQPPGKKPQPLSLLSGGERAMTATALLFALLRVKPTPFVILDEVEAALDEANVERFGKYLRAYSNRGSQFICITHQRGTMEVADSLYGVTMEGTGVSRVVSVRLTDVNKEAS